MSNGAAAPQPTRKRVHPTNEDSEEMENLRTENKRLRTEVDTMLSRIAILEQQLAASRPARQDSPDVEVVGVTRTDDPQANIDLSDD